LSVVRPDLTSARLSTGIKGLDNILQGGFIKGKTYLLTGPAGSGKSISALQFSWAALQAGRNCVYVSCNESPGDLVSGAQGLGWDLKSACANQQLTFLDAGPYFANISDRPRSRHQRRDIRRLVADLAKHVKGNAAQVLVIDPINPLLNDSLHADITAFTREFVHSSENYLGCTTLLTLEMSRGAPAHPIEFAVSGILDLDVISKSGRFARTLLVRKARATPADVCRHRFTISPIQGVSLITAGDGNGAGSCDDQAPEARKDGWLPKIAGQ
jgi:circadian clock protein KaiC